MFQDFFEQRKIDTFLKNIAKGKLKKYNRDFLNNLSDNLIMKLVQDKRFNKQLQNPKFLNRFLLQYDFGDENPEYADYDELNCSLYENIVAKLNNKDLLDLLSSLDDNYSDIGVLDLSNILSILKDKYLTNDSFKNRIKEVLNSKDINNLIALFDNTEILEVIQDQELLNLIINNNRQHYYKATELEILLDRLIKNNNDNSYECSLNLFNYCINNFNEIDNLNYYLKYILKNFDNNTIIDFLNNNILEKFKYNNNQNFNKYYVNLFSVIDNLPTNLQEDYFDKYFANCGKSYKEIQNEVNNNLEKTALYFYYDTLNDETARDKFYEYLPFNQSHLIEYYQGNNVDLYLNLLEKCKSTQSPEFINSLYEKGAKLFSKSDKYFLSIPQEYSSLIQYYTGTNFELFLTNLANCSNKIDVLINSYIANLKYDKNILEKFSNFNERERKFIEIIISTNNQELCDFFKEDNSYQDISEDKLETLSQIVKKIIYSNSSEIIRIKKELINNLKLDNPVESLEKIEDIEDIFLKNNLPYVAKIYNVFQILNPDVTALSPIIQNSKTRSKNIIIFSDLLKSAFGSNNRNLRDYINNLESGSNLFESISNGTRQFAELSSDDKQILDIYVNHLATLFNSSKLGQTNPYNTTGNTLNDIQILKQLFTKNGVVTSSLPDRIISMYCHFAGIDSLKEAKDILNQAVLEADQRGRELAKRKIVLNKGDFIKGIDAEYLGDILQNGCNSKEFLGSSADSDATPLDTDVSMILNEHTTLEEQLRETEADNYGSIWFVLKNDNRFDITRTSIKEDNQSVAAPIYDFKNPKLEAFYTGVVGIDHYGIRTGFPSSCIDYIIVKNQDPKIGFEIARNGFYIPVFDIHENLVFTPEEYDNLRSKMSGLSYYDCQNYNFADDKKLINSEINNIVQKIEQNNLNTQVKRNIINNHIQKALASLNLSLKTKIDGELTEGIVELIDTGSTGRGTNAINDGDFDFMMRLDKAIMMDNEKLETIKKAIESEFESVDEKGYANGDFRHKGVKFADFDEKVDIDISFTQKLDKINYSTDMALQDRLNSIKKQDPQRYNLVIANILYAKKILKENEVYKSSHSAIPQGGLGGVGVENWILQNGGSFVAAAENFLKATEGKTYDQFKEDYQIWDFGENHLNAKKGNYLFDNFITNNMNEVGYEKMKKVLTQELKKTKVEQKSLNVSKYPIYTDRNITKKELLILQRLEMITENSLDDLQTNIKRNENNVVSKIAINYGLNPLTTKIIIDNDFAFVYDVDENKVVIADILITNNQQLSNIQFKVRGALNQIITGNTNKYIDISKLDYQKSNLLSVLINSQENLVQDNSPKVL